MNIKITSMICAGLFACGMSSVSNADTIDILFGNASGDSINYSFTTSLNAGVWSDTFDSAVFNIGGVTTEYLSSEYDLVLDSFFASSAFDVFNAGTQLTTEPVVRMSFSGDISIVDGIVVGQTFQGGPFSGDFSIDFSSRLLADPFLVVPDMTSINVTTVSAVPVPAAVWLFGSGLIGLAGFARRKVL